MTAGPMMFRGAGSVERACRDVRPGQATRPGQGVPVKSHRDAGPVVGTLRELAVGILIAVTAAVLALGTRTAESAYNGTGLGFGENRENGSATPDECRKTGPLSLNGFGYWWSCSARVTMGDGRVVHIETRASALRPGDRDVPMVESCQKNLPSKCTYTRPGNFALAFGVRLLRPVTGAAALFAVAAAVAVVASPMLTRRRRR